MASDKGGGRHPRWLVRAFHRVADALASPSLYVGTPSMTHEVWGAGTVDAAPARTWAMPGEDTMTVAQRLQVPNDIAAALQDLDEAEPRNRSMSLIRGWASALASSVMEAGHRQLPHTAFEEDLSADYLRDDYSHVPPYLPLLRLLCAEPTIARLQAIQEAKADRSSSGHNSAQLMTGFKWGLYRHQHSLVNDLAGKLLVVEDRLARQLVTPVEALLYAHEAQILEVEGSLVLTTRDSVIAVDRPEHLPHLLNALRSVPVTNTDAIRESWPIDEMLALAYERFDAYMDGVGAEAGLVVEAVARKLDMSFGQGTGL